MTGASRRESGGWGSTEKILMDLDGSTEHLPKESGAASLDIAVSPQVLIGTVHPDQQNYITAAPALCGARLVGCERTGSPGSSERPKMQCLGKMGRNAHPGPHLVHSKITVDGHCPVIQGIS